MSGRRALAISITLVAVFLTFIMLMLDFPILLSFLPIIIGGWATSKVWKSGRT